MGVERLEEGDGIVSGGSACRHLGCRGGDGLVPDLGFTLKDLGLEVWYCNGMRRRSALKLTI
jgi:hypothetical protein